MQLAQDSSKLDLQERLSYIQSADGDEYSETKSPTMSDSGALMAGGALDLMSMEAMGLFAQYAAIGVVYGMIPSLNYPIFNVFLNMEGYQTAAYSVLVTLGWSFKVVFGMMSDCVPICGYRRKSWMLIGWAITMTSLAVMAFSSVGDPFCNRANPTFAKYCGQPLQTVPPDAIAANFNLAAPDNGSKFILLSMVVSFGYVLAACASDAMVVQYARREPEAIRGRVQTAIYTVRTVAGMMSVAIVAVGLNGPNFNGSFSFAVAPNVPYAMCLVPCVVAIVSTTFVVVEEKEMAVSMTTWGVGFWALLQQRAMWQVCAFRFINNFFNWISATPSAPIQTYWAHVTPLNDSLSQLAGKAIFAATLAAVASWGLHWNWRWIIALGSVSVVAMDAIVMYLTIWDVVRNQWFFTGVGLSENVPDGVRFIVATYCAVEVADQGVEGATYGLLTTMNNLAAPLASVVYKYIDSFFDVTNDDIKADTTRVRWDATVVYLISYASKLFALVWLGMLPPQKRQMQALKRGGGKSAVAGAVLILLFVTALAFSITSNFMSISPSFKCYRIAGGNGKIDPTTGRCPMP
ncbi:hypothetical protein H310_03639 [Aphanomyces invadans]|uniref:Transmembrane protein n=1 Tax=Aphanomyces invadans TaxID=157072 RepID=A0A024UIM0_9STRA|nr:hypothetical protein H310_03639 [Aphanomyces invadans]ETW06030.1 hypothetical protein H310_03639 [Aphanomyces invadans]|eukprot:XP_008865807.1 hypothetical protein H310_03639 [Aphanomyces invadans]